MYICTESQLWKSEEDIKCPPYFLELNLELGRQLASPRYLSVCIPRVLGYKHSSSYPGFFFMIIAGILTQSLRFGSESPALSDSSEKRECYPSQVLVKDPPSRLQS